MRNVRTQQLEPGAVGIEDIDLDTRSRDDIPALLPGLQHLYADETFRPRLFALMDGPILPGVDRKVGRPGMEMWQILVMGVIRQGLLWDAMRCLIRETGRTAAKHDVPGWRQWKHLMKSVKKRFHKVRSTRRARAQRVEEYLMLCRALVLRAEATLPALIANGAGPCDIEAIKDFLSHAIRQADQVDRRLLKGETIPQHEKVFSIFEQHTRWISKGKAGCPVEPGVPVCILEDAPGFVLHHELMWQGEDVDYAVPMVDACQARFPDLRAVSFDRGFHSPENRVRLDDLPDHNVLPKKGYLSQADRERESDDAFVAMRRQHPAVESAINNLEHRGLDRVRAHGADGFDRVVALSVVAFNIHRVGLLLRRKTQRQRAA